MRKIDIINLFDYSIAHVKRLQNYARCRNEAALLALLDLEYHTELNAEDWIKWAEETKEEMLVEINKAFSNGCYFQFHVTHERDLLFDFDKDEKIEAKKCQNKS